VCVFPSLFENFPYTCLEAMSYGKAIVGSSHGGMTDLLGDGQCGLLYTPPDEHELARHITTLLSNKNLRDELGQKARQRALDYFGSERVMNLTEAFYNKALGECS
jgi:glycogen synthase